jgi:hypothetical protein
MGQNEPAKHVRSGGGFRHNWSPPPSSGATNIDVEFSENC